MDTLVSNLANTPARIAGTGIGNRTPISLLHAHPASQRTIRTYEQTAIIAHRCCEADLDEQATEQRTRDEAHASFQKHGPDGRQKERELNRLVSRAITPQAGPTDECGRRRLPPQPDRHGETETNPARTCFPQSATASPGKLSGNDLMHLDLNWLPVDSPHHGDGSSITQVLRHIGSLSAQLSP